MGFSLNTSDIYPPLEDMTSKIKKFTDKVDFIIASDIVAGFEHTINGETYQFSYDSSDQTNFAQQSSYAVFIINLSALSDEGLIKTFPHAVVETVVEGETVQTVDKSLIPYAFTDTWRTEWRGHQGTDSFTLELTAYEYINLALMGGVHLQTCLSRGWDMKNALSACTTEPELNALVESWQLEQMYSDYTLTSKL